MFENNRPEPTEIEVQVLGVFMVAAAGQQAIVFLSHAGGKVVPVLIGLHEALTIDVANRGVTTPRPLPADLVKVVIDVCGAKVNHVVVDHVDEETFYGKLVIGTTDGETTIDARPSDCIAIALRAGAPMRMTRTVFDQYSMTIDEACDRYKLVEMEHVE